MFDVHEVVAQLMGDLRAAARDARADPSARVDYHNFIDELPHHSAPFLSACKR